MAGEVNKEQLQERAQLVRLYEASTQIEYPTVDELNFRIALMKRLAVGFAFREVRDLEIIGPATSETIRPRKQ